VGWGILLIILGALLLLQNYLPYHFISRAWPLGFIFLGGYLIYLALKDRGDSSAGIGSVVEKKEF
jgi:hypothetical protein